MAEMIRVSGADTKALRLPFRALLFNKFHEYWTKARGDRIKGQGLIGADATTVAEGFRDLRGEDFAEYNLPQVWVERRQIPVAIDGRIPVQGAVIVDLGCGPGTSTEVLCHFADPSWQIFGYDVTQQYIEIARMRANRGEFRNREGVETRPRFVCQDIARPLRLPGGDLLASSSVDFAISGGVVGLYMDASSAAGLAAELGRVVRPGGYTAIDSGPAVPAGTLERVMRDAGFGLVCVAKSFWIEPRPKLVFRRG